MEANKDMNLYGCFSACSISELQEKLLAATDPDEKAFYRTLLNLKLQISQSRLIGKALV